MSRIFEAIQTAREMRTKMNCRSESDTLGEMEIRERRISPRSTMFGGLYVYGRSETGDVFYEPATAISGNANGGVFLLAIPVAEGQELMLFNNINDQEQLCGVLGVRIRDIQSSEVSVSFSEPNASFWAPVPMAHGS
jgi:hypothetical protein